MDINLEHLINSYKTTCNLSNNTIIAKENFKNLMNDNNSVILQVKHIARVFHFINPNKNIFIK